MLAFVSYLPLSGDGGACGDGIIPRNVATLEGSTIVELPSSKHSGRFSLELEIGRHAHGVARRGAHVYLLARLNR